MYFDLIIDILTMRYPTTRVTQIILLYPRFHWHLLRFSVPYTHAKSSWLWLKYNPCAKTGPHSPRERVPDVISSRRVYKHFRLMQMQNPADIMKKITRHVVSIDNEGTVIRAHWHVNRAGFARVWVMLMVP